MRIRGPLTVLAGAVLVLAAAPLPVAEVRLGIAGLAPLRAGAGLGSGDLWLLAAAVMGASPAVGALIARRPVLAATALLPGVPLLGWAVFLLSQASGGDRWPLWGPALPAETDAAIGAWLLLVAGVTMVAGALTSVWDRGHVQADVPQR